MALLTTIRDLHRRKGRERRGLALAEGVRLVEEMLATRAVCKGVVASPALDATPRGGMLRQSLTERGLVPEQVSDADLLELATTDHPQGIVAVYQPRAWTLPEVALRPGHPVVVLDAIQDPGNAGSIARTALALGAAGVIALPGTADLTNPKCVRGAMGALFRLPHLHLDDEQLCAWLATQQAELVVAAMRGEPVSRFESSAPVALVLGNEGAGVRAELERRAARTVTIPIVAEAESLNVAVAAGILLYQLTR